VLVIYPHLSAITETTARGYRVAPGSQAAIGQYLLTHGVQLASISTHRELLECLRYCNARDLERTLSKPAARNDLRLLWQAIRRAMRLSDHLPGLRNADAYEKTANANSTPAYSSFTSPSSRFCSEEREQVLRETQPADSLPEAIILG